MTRRLLVALVCALAASPALAADLGDPAIRAYDEYLQGARQAFISRARTAPIS